MHPIPSATDMTEPQDSGGVMQSFLVTTVAPVIGVCASEFLAFGPLRAILACRKEESLGDVNPLPFPLLFGNGIGWVIYGAITRNTFVFVGNIGGVVMSLFYLLTAHTLTTSARVRMQLEIIAISLLFLWCVVGFSVAMLDDRQQAVSVIGIVGNIVVLFLFASPLATFAKVIREKNSISINKPFAFCQVVNCVVWTAYGTAIGDFYVAAPNVFGLALGAAQVFLIFRYPSHMNKSAQSDASGPAPRALAPYAEFDSPASSTNGSNV